MKKLIYIVGIRGNMASRYKAILTHLGHDFDGHDKGEEFKDSAEIADGFIVATPTRIHLETIDYCIQFLKPILCEKPITRNFEELRSFMASRPAELVTMVNQYLYYPGYNHETAEGATSYAYFKTGQDGLYWDTINIIGLAKKEFNVTNSSPIWTCALNGSKLTLGRMDHAYVSMVEAWLNDPVSNIDYAIAAHEKVETILKTVVTKKKNEVG